MNSSRHKLIITIFLLTLILGFPILANAIGPYESNIVSHGTFISQNGDDEIVRIDADNLKLIAKGLDEVTLDLTNMDAEFSNIEAALMGEYSATEPDVLTGKTFSSSSGIGLTGTMPNRTSETIITDISQTTSTGTAGTDGFALALNLTSDNNLDGYYNNPIDISAIGNEYYQKGYLDGTNRSYNASTVYKYHVHSTTGTEQGTVMTATSYEDYRADVAALSSATSQSSGGGGCFTNASWTYKTACGGTVRYTSHSAEGNTVKCRHCGKVYVTQHTGWCPGCGEYEGTYASHYGTWYGSCNKCGKSYSVSYYLNETPGNSTCNAQISKTTSNYDSIPSSARSTAVAKYSLGCGHTQGELLTIEIEVNPD